MAQVKFGTPSNGDTPGTGVVIIYYREKKFSPLTSLLKMTKCSSEMLFLLKINCELTPGQECFCRTGYILPKL